MNFVNLGLRDGALNTGVAPVLATAYSDVFQVYSAKKFPGVIESTGLSKCFARQGKPLISDLSQCFFFITNFQPFLGIKIPIRRDKGDGLDL
jgi:hypothetical protein